MSQPINREGSVSIFLLVALVIGAVAGAVSGALLDGVISGRRLLAILAALVAVTAVGIVRRFLGETFPRLFLEPTPTRISVAAWVSIVVSALIGGLAGDDLSELAGTSAGVFIGLFSGTVATISMAMLVIVYLRNLLRNV